MEVYAVSMVTRRAPWWQQPEVNLVRAQDAETLSERVKVSIRGGAKELLRREAS